MWCVSLSGVRGCRQRARPSCPLPAGLHTAPQTLRPPSQAHRQQAVGIAHRGGCAGGGHKAGEVVPACIGHIPTANSNPTSHHLTQPPTRAPTLRRCGDQESHGVQRGMLRGKVQGAAQQAPTTHGQSRTHQAPFPYTQNISQQHNNVRMPHPTGNARKNPGPRGGINAEGLRKAWLAND